VLKVGGLVADGVPEDLVVPMLVGIVTAGLSGWVAVWGTLRWVRSRTFLPFVIYRIALGVLILVLLASGVR
jgi:undecaprenyl-diphosphatase